MDYQKSIQNLLKEAKAGLSYKQLAKPYRTFLKIALFPLIIAEIAMIISYYVLLFFYNATMSPVSYLESWQDKKKEGIQHATQAVLYFVSTPFIFFLRVVLSLMSFGFFFLWFFLMCYTYLVTLGGIKWQPCINVVTEREGGETRLKASAGEKFATVALLFMAFFVILIPFANLAGEALTIAACAYGVVIVLVNAIVSSTARAKVIVVKQEDVEAVKSNLVYRHKNSIFDNFVFASVMLGIVGLAMFIQSWADYGVDLFIRFYTYAHGLPFVSIIVMVFCVAMALSRVSYLSSVNTTKGSKAKVILATILVVICGIASMFGTVQYIRYHALENARISEYPPANSSYSSGDENSEREEEIIDIAQSSSVVKYEITDACNLYSYSDIIYDEYYCTAYRNSDGSWRVTLKGSISGYDSGYNKQNNIDFTAYVTVSETGSVLNVTAYNM